MQQDEYALGRELARSLFAYKGNPKSFDCDEDQLARIIHGCIEWSDKTRENFERSQNKI